MASDIPGTLLLDRDTLDAPYAFYRRLQREAPVWQIPGNDIFIVTSYNLIAEAALRTSDFSSNLLDVIYRGKDGLPARLRGADSNLQILATADPPVHSEQRKILAPLFTPKRLSRWEPDIATVAANCIDQAAEKAAVEFMSEVANVVPITIIAQFIGFKNSNIEQLLQAAFDSTAVVGGALSESELVATGMRAMEVFAWIKDQLEQATAEDDGILGMLNHAVDRRELEIDCAVAMLHLLLSAGGESTTSLIGNTVSYLAKDQVLQQQIRANPALVSPLLEEVLRLESPFRSHYRTVRKQTNLGNVTIPAGSLVLLFWAAANRDPAIFDHPDELLLDRPRRHLTFGHGIHTCIGAPLARLEATIVMRELLARTSKIAADPGEEPRWEESLQVRRYKKLPIILTAS